MRRIQPTAQQGFRVSLKQIAEATGHSKMTVSRALRGNPDIAVKTRAQILAMARKFGYRPNLLVRGLQTGRSGNIALLVAPLDDFGSGIVRGVHDTLVKHQYLPLLHWKWTAKGEKIADVELEMIHRVIDRRVEGVILFPQDDAVPDLYFRELWKRGVPLVTVDRQLPRTRADFVGTDDLAGAKMAAEHLLELGHLNVAHLAGTQKAGTFADRRSSFEGTISSGHGQCKTVEVLNLGSLGAVVQGLLQSNPRPTALFLATDHFALVVYQVAAKLGLRIPEDLSVVGFAGLGFTQYLNPPLTTVAQDPCGIGREAARIILERCTGKCTKKEPMQLRLRPELMVRNSTTTAPSKLKTT